jgi:hypothetical protein
MNMKNENKAIKELIHNAQMTKKALLRLENNLPVRISWVSKKKAAEYYDVSERQIQNWKNDKKIKTKEINGKIYYDIEPLLCEPIPVRPRAAATFGISTIMNKVG